MKTLCDMHIHSENSFDGENTVREICDSAVERGLSIIALTDHMEAPEIDLGAKSQFGDMLSQIAKSVSDVEDVAPDYSGRLTLLKGMELGEPMHFPKLTKKALELADFDFILASIHNIRNEEDFYFMEYTESACPELLKRYFDEILETAENADFDSLAHLTYPLRYIVERLGITPDLDPYADTIDSIFKALIRREKALEVNTSGLFIPIGTTLPDIGLVRRFRELGGKYVTVGSDAHRIANVARGIEEGIELIRTCGFEHYTVFENRHPRMVEIWY